MFNTAGPSLATQPTPQYRQDTMTTSYSDPSGLASRQNSYSSLSPTSPTNMMAASPRIAHPGGQAHNPYMPSQHQHQHTLYHASQSPSPTHTGGDESSEHPSDDRMRYYTHPSAYHPLPSSPQGYGGDPTQGMYMQEYKPEYMNTIPRMTPSSSSEFSQPTTPAQTGFYVSNGVSGSAPQPCNTYSGSELRDHHPNINESNPVNFSSPGMRDIQGYAQALPTQMYNPGYAPINSQIQIPGYGSSQTFNAPYNLPEGSTEDESGQGGYGGSSMDAFGLGQNYGQGQYRPY